MNWGYKIVAAFSVFVVFLGILIYRSYQSNIQLVAPDYYQQELVFQQQIDQLENERNLPRSVLITVDSGLDVLLISFPANLQVHGGEISFYRPSDASLDRTYSLNPDHQNSQALPISQLQAGLWEVKVEWGDGTRSYIKQQNVYLP